MVIGKYEEKMAELEKLHAFLKSAEAYKAESPDWKGIDAIIAAWRERIDFVTNRAQVLLSIKEFGEQLSCDELVDLFNRLKAHDRQGDAQMA